MDEYTAEQCRTDTLLRDTIQQAQIGNDTAENLKCQMI